MKTTLSLIFTLFFFVAQAQLEKVEMIDFYKWSNQDVHYNTVVVSENFIEAGEGLATVRVKYNLDGLTKMVEFDALASFESYDQYFELYFMGGDDAAFITGSGSYTPDNFLLTYDWDGNYLSGVTADHNALEQENVEFSDLDQIMVRDANHLRELIKEFYSSNDPIYRDLMVYASQFD
ncbi:hypothetical protein [Moheibacter lacus]|uniref:Uncharacterized protein n=1 Tax=Moheibacter lacus TaxID=2745851 RepID=A0A838ZNL4_9FLAO|nr:hypothetical protein [Moheibacter lacus]MBA5629306.1 hypothetical protein [Moheibacter lacus]